METARGSRSPSSRHALAGRARRDRPRRRAPPSRRDGQALVGYATWRTAGVAPRASARCTAGRRRSRHVRAISSPRVAQSPAREPPGCRPEDRAPEPSSASAARRARSARVGIPPGQGGGRERPRQAAREARARPRPAPTREVLRVAMAGTGSGPTGAGCRPADEGDLGRVIGRGEIDSPKKDGRGSRRRRPPDPRSAGLGRVGEAETWSAGRRRSSAVIRYVLARPRRLGAGRDHSSNAYPAAPRNPRG